MQQERFKPCRCLVLLMLTLLMPLMALAQQIEVRGVVSDNFGESVPGATISNVSHVWVASPDNLGGVPQELSFSQNGSTISFTLPKLKYWDMIVIE